jgi:hypothetical protein
VETLGALGSAESLPALRELAEDPRVRAGTQDCVETAEGDYECENWALVKTVVEEAVEFVEERERAWREQREAGQGAQDVLTD